MFIRSFLTKIISFFTQARKWLFEVFIPAESNKYLSLALSPKLLFCYSSALLLIKIAAISFFLVLPYSNFFSAITQDRLISLINQARQNNNLPPVSVSTALNKTADFKVNDMLVNNYFEHTSPSGITPWFWFKKAGYNYAFAGENLAIDFSQTDDVFSAWMASPAHRDNILNPNFSEIGLAVKSGPLQKHEAILAVLVFGKQNKEEERSVAVKNQSEAPKTAPTNTSSAPKISKMTTPTTAKELIINPPTSTPPLIQVLAEKENIELKGIGIAGEITENSKTNKQEQSGSLAIIAGKWTPKVLGVFASKADEATKSFYLYFTLFLALALMVNIFVKIEIQYWQTIFSTALVILLSSVLIFI